MAMLVRVSQLWLPPKELSEQSRLYAFLQKLGVDNLEQLQARLPGELDWFWSAAIEDLGISWTQRPTRIHDAHGGIAWTQWWLGGRLNCATNAVDAHLRESASREAVVWESEDGLIRKLTYAQLSAEVCRAANALGKLGVVPGDAVGLCMPMTPECVALFLACAKIGAIVCPLFSGYGADAIASRLNDCEARVLCISDGFLRRGQEVLQKPVADEVAKLVPSLKHILVVKRLGGSCSMQRGRDQWYHNLITDAPSTQAAYGTAADDTFMLIYTSGTTGKPKGTVHVHGGFPIKAMQDMAHCFDVQPQDRLLWFTDIGWMMGPWAILGTLALGATLVLFEGVPDWPEPDRLWQVVEDQQVTVLGVAPTVVRSLMRSGLDPVRKHNLKSLRILGASGEPWNVDPWNWFVYEIGEGRCPLINYSGGTEVSGGIVGGNLLSPMAPCSFAGPCPGMNADVFGEDGKPVRGAVGELVVKSPWPGMTQGFWRDPDRYLGTYWSRWPGVWVHGDWAEIDSDGLWYIRGRSDDTIKVAGKRIGPAEIESVLVSHPAVAEAAAIGIPDELKGEALVCFCVVKPGVTADEELRTALINYVIASQGKPLGPKAVEFVTELPKTRNAKVLRRVLRAIYLGSDPGDLSSLENRSAIESIEKVRSKA